MNTLLVEVELVFDLQQETAEWWKSMNGAEKLLKGAVDNFHHNRFLNLNKALNPKQHESTHKISK